MTEATKEAPAPQSQPLVTEQDVAGIIGGLVIENTALRKKIALLEAALSQKKA